jgi:hypothetical protein
MFVASNLLPGHGVGEGFARLKRPGTVPYWMPVYCVTPPSKQRPVATPNPGTSRSTLDISEYVDMLNMTAVPVR